MPKIEYYEQRFHQIVNNILDIIVELDVNGIFTYVSPQVYDILGYNPDELIGGEGLKFIHPEDLKKSMKEMGDLLKNNNNDSVKKLSIESRVLHKKGHYISLSAKGSLVEIEGDKKIIVVVSDVTEQLKAKQKLKESEEKFRTIIENAKEGYYEVDLEGNFTFFNSALSNLLKYSPKELMGMNFKNYMNDKNRKLTFKAFNKVYRTGVELPAFQYELINKNEENLYGESSIYLRYDSDGEKIGFSGFIRDISERKKAEQKLKESEGKYRNLSNQYEMLLESITDSIFALNSDWEYILVNKSAENINSLSRDEIIGKKMQDLFPGIEDTPFFKIYESVMNTRNEERIIESFTHPDGETRFYDLSVYPIHQGILCISRDVTEEKEIQQELEESEEKYRSLFNNMNAGFAFHEVIVDDEKKPIDYKYIEVNPAFEKLTGLKTEDMIGKNVSEVLPGIKDDPADWIGKFGNVGLTGIPISVEDYSEPIDRWYKVAGYSPKKGYFAVTFTDITERKKSEQNLKESEEKYRQFIEDSLEGVWVIDENANTTLVNPSMSKILGYSVEELIGKNLFEFVPQEDIEITNKHLENRRNGIKEEFEKEFIQKDGKKVYTRLISSPNFDNNGNYAGSFAFVSDITEKKEAEQKLKESEEKFRTIAEQSVVGLVMIQDNRLIYLNNTVSKILGYLPEELMNKNVLDLFKTIHPEDRTIAANQLSNRLDKKKIDKMRKQSFRIFTKSGEIRWIKMNSNIFQFQEKDTILVTMVDVTKERMAEIELQKLNELKSEFLRRASHELKTPLISIKGFTNLVLTQYGGTLDNEVISMLEEVDRGCHRLEDIIKNLIETTKIESSKIDLKATVEDLSFLIRFCLNELRGLAKSRNHAIHVKIDKKIITKFNKEQMYEVITNLLSNAIKYTPPTGEITIESEIKDQNVIISIKDNGIGFTDKEKEIVFKQFGKIERYGQGLDIGIDGSGLGLYLSKKIVELHGGNIWMESEGKNKGSIFYISLPLIEN